MKEKDESAMIKEIIESQRCVLDTLQQIVDLQNDDLAEILDLQSKINTEIECIRTGQESPPDSD